MSVTSGGSATAAVASAAAAQATVPTRTIQTRVVPRSRIVARRALYSSESVGVMVSATTGQT